MDVHPAEALTSFATPLVAAGDGKWRRISSAKPEEKAWRMKSAATISSPF